jgi:hypothetical protein
MNGNFGKRRPRNILIQLTGSVQSWMVTRLHLVDKNILVLAALSLSVCVLHLIWLNMGHSKKRSAITPEFTHDCWGNPHVHILRTEGKN